VKIKSNAMKRRLELSSQNGEVVNVSNQVSGYPRIVEMLRQRRPDLFGKVEATPAQGSFASVDHYNAPTVAGTAFTGTTIFKKSFFAQYGVMLLMLPLCIVGPLLIFANNDMFSGIGVGLIGLFFMTMSLFNINHVKVEPNKLTTESFFGEKNYTAKQIKEISMKSVRSRRGVASNFIHIQPIEGGAISLAGFSEGDEVLYGFLTNWWDTYKNK
jgi:hypothetical protein